MPSFFSQDWSGDISVADMAALACYFTALFGYRFFLSLMLRHRPHNLFLGKLQQYRIAWIETHSHASDSIVVVQTLRNTIMSASFLASTAIILIMGAFNLLGSKGEGDMMMLASGSNGISVEHLRILLIIVILAYSFFNFTWYIRETNYMSYILNIPKDVLDSIENGDSTQHIARMFLSAGMYFSLGMRGYYFLIPLLLWFFTPILMILSTAVILFILLRRDLNG